MTWYTNAQQSVRYCVRVSTTRVEGRSTGRSSALSAGVAGRLMGRWAGRSVLCT